MSHGLVRSWGANRSHRIRPVKVTKRLTPSTEEEREYVRRLHAERPDLTMIELNRLRFRKFGIDRNYQSMRRWIADDPSD